MRNKSITFLILFSSTLFIALFLVLSFNNRLTSDDFLFSSFVKEKGIIGTTSFLYENWSGRWTAYSLANVVYFLYSKSTIILFLFSLINLAFTIFSVFILLKLISKKIKFEIENSFLFLLSLYFTSTFFYLTPDKGECWFWTISVPIYLLSLNFILLGFSFIFNGSRKSLNYFLIAVCFIYIGGASEIYALLAIFIFIVLLIFYKKSDVTTCKEIIFGFIFCLLSFLITYLSAGNKIRANALPSPSFVQALKLSVLTLWHLLKVICTGYLHFIILFSTIWFIAGTLINKGFTINNKNLRKSFLMFLFTSFAIVFIIIFLTTYILSDIAPGRILTIVYFIVSLSIFVCSFSLGLIFDFPNKKSFRFILLSVFVVLVFVQLCILKNQFIITKQYSSDYDKRIEKLESAKNAGKDICIESLPVSGYLYSKDISADTASQENKNLVKYLDLKFNVRLK
ncbi:MAG: DUF6056 family protein [Bacteroidales bacterium]|nr:DUF6056 family protein [Bacteroidales bacterium]